MGLVLRLPVGQQLRLFPSELQHPPPATASSPGASAPFHCLEMKVWDELVVLLQLQHLHPNVPPCAEGTRVDHALGTTDTRLNSPVKSSSNWVTGCGAGQPTPLPHWELLCFGFGFFCFF